MAQPVVFKVAPAEKLSGKIRVPGDKSISHRAIMLGSLADGTTHIQGFLEGDDCLATLDAFRAMGVEIEGPENGAMKIHGVGIDGLRAPDHVLDMGNSGTSMRLMTGLMAGQTFDATMVGDSSLMSRPMRRVTNPVSMMGADISITEKGTAPIKIRGGCRLQGIDYRLPVASAQVKSCVLLAGLYAQGETRVTEPAPTRDHTERMLQGFGYKVYYPGPGVSSVQGGKRLTATDIDVPTDISSAAFFMVGASIAEGSDIVLEHVGVNPTRTGIIEILKLMGADISLGDKYEAGGEPVADIYVRSAPLKGIHIPEELVPLAIDEFPAIFIAAACAQGKTTVSGAEELRLKESDRIQAMANGLRVLGVTVQPVDDGIIIEGGEGFIGGEIESHGDHRVAMSFAMASLRASGDIHISDCANIDTSFPDFDRLANLSGLHITIE